GRVHARWLEAMDRAARLGLPFVGLPAGLWHEQDDLRLLCRAGAERGLGALCPLELRDLPRAGATGFLDELCALQPALLPVLDLGAVAHVDELDPVIEDELPPLLHERGLALCVTLRRPLGPGGTLLRRAAFAVDAVGALAPVEDARDLAALHAQCLAARPLDRPALLSVAVADAAQLGPILAMALATGMALVQVAEAGGSAGEGRAVDEVLADALALLDELPPALPAPRPEAWASMLLDRQAMPDADESAARAEVPIASLGFVRDLAGAPARFLFEAASRHEPPPQFVHVPAHGALDEGSWSRLWSLAGAGSHVLVTGLCFGGPASTRRLAELGLSADVVPADRLGAFPHWLRRRAILDTNGIVVTIARGRGSLSFLDLCPELADAGAERPELDPLRETLGFPLAPHAGFGWSSTAGAIDWRPGEPLLR
ncbi:MAG: hypothetical protein R3F30_06810, partial [Planctomycetota bacterium]